MYHIFLFFSIITSLNNEFTIKKIYDDKILCQTILNEVGFAMLPGSDFGLEKGKLLSRIAFVDFNGEEALRLISEESRWSEF